MRQGNGIGPDREIVHGGSSDVVCGSEADHGGKESPGAEDTTGEGLTWYGAVGVEEGGVLGGAVGLQAVDCRYDGDLVL